MAAEEGKNGSSSGRRGRYSSMGIEEFPEEKPLSREVIGAAMHVSRVLGHGFVEKIYENALALELDMRGIKVVQQEPVQVRYGDRVIGQFVTDLLVGDRVIVEVKAAAGLHRDFELQCLNYLRATGLKVCLLLNFGQRRLEFRRIVLSNPPVHIIPNTFSE